MVKRRRSATGTASPYNVQVLDRAVALLDALGNGQGELALGELASRVALNKSTVHRLLSVLERHRLVARSASDGRYRLGLRLFELGSAAVEGLDMRQRARPHLEWLVGRTGETAHLCVLDGGEVLYLEKVGPSRTVRMPSRIGQRNPVHCTAVGKALIAELSDEQLAALVRSHGLARRTRNTITSLERLCSELATVRARGYSVDKEEIEEGLTCIGAPVRDARGVIVASVSIAGPTFRITAAIPSLAEVVVRAANALSSDLGHRAAQAASGARRRTPARRPEARV